MQMKPVHVIGIVVGALAGLILATLFRPSIPMLGQPPIGTSFSALTATGEDFGFREQFSQMLFLYVVLGGIAGAVGAFLVGRAKERT